MLKSKCQRKGISANYFGNGKGQRHVAPPITHGKVTARAVMKKTWPGIRSARGRIKKQAIVHSIPSRVFFHPSYIYIRFFFFRFPDGNDALYCSTPPHRLLHTPVVRSGVRNPSFPFVLFNVCRLPSRPMNG